MKGKKFFALIFIGHGINDIAWLMIPLLLPLIKEEFALTYMESGLVLACFGLSFSAFSFIHGHLADIYDPIKILFFGFLFTPIAFCLFLLANSFFQTVAVLILAAIGVSAFHPVAFSFIGRHWQKGSFFGFFEMTGVMGTLIMCISISSLLISFGWRQTSIFYALLGVPIAFLLFTFHGFYKISPPGMNFSVNRQESEFVGYKPVLFFTLSRICQMLGMVGLVSFLPLFGVDVWKFSPEAAVVFPLFLYVGTVLGDLITGILSDRYSPLKVIFALCMVAIPTIFILTLNNIPLLMVLAFIGVIGVCNGGSWPPQDLWLSRVSPLKTLGRRFGVLVGLLNVPMFLSPLLLGFLADNWGLITAFQWTILPIAIATLLLGKTIRGTQPS